MTCLCPLGVTAVILTTTLLITALGAAIIGLILKMQRGKLLRQNKDIWWQISYDDITILPQNKVRPHLTQIYFLLTAGDLWRRPHLVAYESKDWLVYKVRSLKPWVLVLGLPFPCWISLRMSFLGLSYWIFKNDQIVSSFFQLYYLVAVKTFLSCWNVKAVFWKISSHFPNHINSFNLLTKIRFICPTHMYCTSTADQV